MALFRLPPSLKRLLLAASLSLGLSLAWAAPEPKVVELSDDTSDLLNSDFRPAYDAKDWDKALGVLDKILTKVAPDSYDAVYAYKAKAQINYANNNIPAALESLERCLTVEDKKHYLSEKEDLEVVFGIAQYAYNQGSSSKEAKKQATYYVRAVEMIERWSKTVDPKALTPDIIYFASVVYATAGEGIEQSSSQKTDKPMMEKALAWIDRGLRSTTHPRDNFYQLKIIVLYQLGRFEEEAECLELLVKQKPDNKNNWQQLTSTYLQLAAAAEKKDEKAAFSYNVRAIIAFERAQKLGALTSPKENYNLVTIYFTINQYDRACDLLERGLKTGAIESTRQNWEVLAYSYQQVHKDVKAVEILEEAAKAFPKVGQLEYEIAQVYFGIDKTKEALAHIKLCVAKGGTEKPQVAWLLYAYLALDLKVYDEALKAAEEAAKYPEAEKEARKMIEAIKAEVTNRETQMKTY
jgi:tetratricopeptide (TPR) repeat protein